jgi:phosphoribosylamine--glycine ligase
MKVLLLGSGGREHAIGWKLAQSPNLRALMSAPGNPGLAELGAVVPDVDITDPATVTDLAIANGVDLVVVGPEAPLAAGVVDHLVERDIAAFGPSAAGARLEASKAYAKEIMARAGIPTAPARTFTDFDAAVAYLRELEAPWVVKADGLAAGKGVLVTEDPIAAEGWVRVCLDGHFGDAGSTVVIEQHLDGQEVSVLAVCDGERALILEPARDYKRLNDGSTGPNTGGMGCFSPVADLPPGLKEMVLNQVLEPALAALAEDGVSYRGFLFAGMMLTSDGPKVLEFNCRLGDPETQVILPRLDEDFLDLLARATQGDLEARALRFSKQAAVDVVLAADGYPENPVTGEPIEFGALPENVLVFHAGTKHTPGGLRTSSGRVLNVVGLGSDVATARARAYAGAAEIHFGAKQHRMDIAG